MSFGDLLAGVLAVLIVIGGFVLAYQAHDYKIFLWSVCLVGIGLGAKRLFDDF